MKLSDEALKAAMTDILSTISKYDGLCWSYTYNPDYGCSIHIYEEENTDEAY